MKFYRTALQKFFQRLEYFVVFYFDQNVRGNDIPRILLTIPNDR